MKRSSQLFLSAAIVLAGMIFTACGASRQEIRATSPNTEVVEAEGMSPVINNDITSARKASREDALRNALGLVIGVYVSQEALVSKAVLIEENITSQTEGYVERYDLLKEWREVDFYKTRIKALVRKEDLSAKLKALQLEPKRLGNPVVKIAIEEKTDGQAALSNYAEGLLKKRFIEQGFTVSDLDNPDIIVSGRVLTAFNTDNGLGGLISYRAALELKAVKPASRDVIATAEETAGGVDVTKDAAAKASIVNVTEKIAGNFPKEVLKCLQERSMVQLVLHNVENINKLNDFTRSARALNEIRDCWVRNFANGIAIVDMDLRKGTSSDIARRLESGSYSIKIRKITTYDIEAEIPGK